MTRFSDPFVVERDLVALKNFWHATHGLYIWEYFTTLDFELDVIRRRRPYRWTIWIYFITRLSTLITIILDFVALDTTTPINCQLWVTLQIIFGYLSLITASLLVVLRIIAIWNKHKFIVGISITVWATNIGVIALGIARLRSRWDPILQNCVVTNTEENKANIIATLISDVVLLLIALIGLLRLLHDSGGSFALGRLLWKQGVIWLLIATVAEVPPTVFIILNLNDSLNLMFQLPAVIGMSIAAARMYRSLTDFVGGSTDIALESFKIVDGKTTKAKWHPSAPTGVPLRKIEVTVDVNCEQHPTAQPIVIMDSDGRLGDRLHRSSLDNDLESTMVNPEPG